MRTYSDLMQLRTFDERFEYLSLSSDIGAATFGFDRWINQQFYHSREWRQLRSHVIARDMGLDLGMDDYIIANSPRIHHLNPITLEDIETASDNLLDPEFLISTALRTHNAIHFGDKKLLPRPFVERRPGDTQLWGKR